MHDQERLRSILKKKMVKTIVCSRPLQPVHLQAMLNFIGNINVYPPLSLQMRTVGPMEPLCSEVDVSSMVTTRISYLVQITGITIRYKKKQARIMYQKIHQVGHGNTEVVFNKDFTKDELELDKLINCKGMVDKYPEFKVDFRQKTKTKVETGVIMQLSFITFADGSAHCYEWEKGWELERVQTWPLFLIDLPEGNVDPSHAFFRVTELMGEALYDYLNFYGEGRHPF